MARTPNITITDADRAVLGPLAEHRILIVPQVALLIGVGEGAAARRLQRLDEKRLVRYERVFQGVPAAARITTRGLSAIEHPLRAPNENLREYRHDVGVGWLWLAARAGAFGAVTRIATDRMMRAADGAAEIEGRAAGYGVGLGLVRSSGRPQRHYPDLMLDTAGGQRVAVELEMTQKSSRRMARIMAAYASGTGIDAVIYLVANRAIGELVSDTARRAGIGETLHVQRIAPDGIVGTQPRTPEPSMRPAQAGHGTDRGLPRAGTDRGLPRAGTDRGLPRTRAGHGPER